MVIFNSYVSLPEGIHWELIVISHLHHPLHGRLAWVYMGLPHWAVHHGHRDGADVKCGFVGGTGPAWSTSAVPGWTVHQHKKCPDLSQSCHCCGHTVIHIVSLYSHRYTSNRSMAYDFCHIPLPALINFCVFLQLLVCGSKSPWTWTIEEHLSVYPQSIDQWLFFANYLVWWQCFLVA